MKARTPRLIVLGFLSACSISPIGGDNNNNNGTGDKSKWAVALALPRSTLTVQHGSTDTMTLTVTRSGGFTGAVTLVADMLPGAAVTLGNQATTGAVTSALLSVSPYTGSDVVYSIPFGVHVNTDVDNVRLDTMIVLNVTRKNGFWTTAPATMSVGRGGASGPTRVTFTKTGFTDDVTASLPLFNGAPAGITATFSPNPIVGDTVTMMTVLVDASVPEGSYSVGVRMNGGGYQGTAPLTLTVTAAVGLSMNFATNPLIMAKGLGNSTFINLVRTNLTAGITPTVTSTLPTGVTVSFGPPTSFGPTVSMSVNTTAAAAPGTYTVNVTSGGAGVPVVTIPLTLTITP